MSWTPDRAELGELRRRKNLAAAAKRKATIARRKGEIEAGRLTDANGGQGIKPSVAASGAMTTRQQTKQTKKLLTSLPH